jgi:small subunit ribosomal protein S9
VTDESTPVPDGEDAPPATEEEASAVEASTDEAPPVAEPVAETPPTDEPSAEAAEATAAEAPEAAEAPVVEEPPPPPPAPRPMPVAKGGRPAATLGTGRRKEAVARVRLVAGTGQFDLGGRTLEDVFPNRAHRMQITAPLRIADRERDLDVVARLHGGGVSGQAGALRHGIARALVDLDPELRPRMKAEGFLTRDSREKERRKYGLKKARKAPQYSKR